ncbi:hypothetical protein HD806DRAFT_533471 [Xylariaceae sp. AK1471]|nr:hypothetical protein HD806DRAFT_533471 [Xylariaceae sp. AK1471]
MGGNISTLWGGTAPSSSAKESTTSNTTNETADKTYENGVPYTFLLRFDAQLQKNRYKLRLFQGMAYAFRDFGLDFDDPATQALVDDIMEAEEAEESLWKNDFVKINRLIDLHGLNLRVPCLCGVVHDSEETAATLRSICALR